MTYLESLERDYTLAVKEGWFARVDAPARTRPAPLTKTSIAALGDAERLRYEEERSVWHANLGPVLTPEMHAVLADLDEIIEANRQDGDKVKSSALLDAHPGLGKTTLAVMFAAGFHRRQLDIFGPDTADGNQRIPVAYIGLTSNTSMRSFNSMLCRFYGHPGAERGNATQLANRAADCVSSCKTRLIVVDDVHFLDMNRRDGREVANHFKWLSNQFPVTFMYVGVGLRHGHLLNEGLTAADRQFAQTARRWTRLTLSPFEIGTDEGRRDWRRLLLAIERDLVLADARPGDLANELADYLYVRSTGHFASLMTYITRGCRRAITTGAERLTKDLIDHIRNDEAAELARLELQAAIDHGLLSARARASSGAA